jgi:hypothetical protein
MKKTLESLLSYGIAKNNYRIKKFPNYINEIKLKKNKQKQKIKFPFENQEKSFIDLARVLSTNYPYAVLVGSPGIGKSMMINYLIDLLTLKKDHLELKQISFESYKLIDQILKKSKKFKQKHYIFLPNLKDSNNVVTLAYDSIDMVENDCYIADKFSFDIVKFFNSFSTTNKNKLKIKIKKKDLNSFLDEKIYDFYFNSLNNFNDAADNIILNDNNNCVIIPSLNIKNINNQIKFNYNLFISNYDKIDIKSTKDTNFYKNLKKISEDNFLNSLHDFIYKNIMKKNIFPFLNDFIENIYRVEIPNLSTNNFLFYFIDYFNNYTKNNISSYIKNFNNYNIVDQNHLISNYSFKYNPKYFDLKISDGTINFIKNNLDYLLEEVKIEKPSLKLEYWIKNIINYFKDETKILERNLLRFNEIIETNNKNNLFKDFNILNQAKNKNHNDSKENKKSIENNLEICFQIYHGSDFFDLEDILEANAFINYSTTTKGLNWSKINNVDKKNLFADFNDSSELVIPHLSIKKLGSFFQNEILLFNDSFSDFIEIITDSKNSGAKEQLLEYLQTGILTLENNGINFQIEAPKILIACDNEDPFITSKGLFLKDQSALRQRIKIIYVNEYADNIKKIRDGTLNVIYDCIEKFNSENHFNKKIIFDDEAINMLLQSTLINENICSLKYRELTQRIEDYYAYAYSKNKSIITAKFIKNKEKKEINNGYFYDVDLYFDKYLSMPNKQKGFVNGLYVTSNNSSGVISINSYFREGISYSKQGIERFELIDEISSMVGNTTIKGYELAKDYIINIISNNKMNDEFFNNKFDWKIKTQFNNWQKIDGPSASLAIALSIISALSGDELYKNRFVTGTLMPLYGNVGEIGGAYHKSLVPYRIKENLKKKRNNEELYFLFPNENLKDYVKESIFDPFNVQSTISCIPLSNINQAYHLMTCGDVITIDDWKNSEKYGKEKINNAFKKLLDLFN